MLGFGEGEEFFFDTAEYLVSEESVVGRDRTYGDSDYDIWLREPCSIKERREPFLSRMGFVESEPVKLNGIFESSSVSIDNNLLSERQQSNSEANCSVDYSDHEWSDDVSVDLEGDFDESLSSDGQCEIKQVQACLGEGSRVSGNKKKVMQWCRGFKKKLKKKTDGGTITRMRVESNRKKYVECSALYAVQELKAHDGRIRTMKFSLDGKYLASGGEDGVVCIWRVTQVDASCKGDKYWFSNFDEGNESSHRKKKPIHASTFIPKKVFHIEEVPLQKFHGHGSDVLDLAWSTSNHLLSSSMDKTVRLWQVGSDKCLGILCHGDYVTCVKFNPVDENYFISGSIDGKVRIWGISRKRVVDWFNVRDVVTAICYQPNGKGFVVGFVSGACQFYEFSGDEILLSGEISLRTRKKSSGNKIMSIEFLQNESQRAMITSNDSKIWILDGLEVIQKYGGLPKSGVQVSTSFTSRRRCVVSVGDDNQIYLWKYDDLCIPTSNQAKTTRSCEYFFSEGVSIALPWLDSDLERNCFACCNSPSFASTHDHQEVPQRLWESRMTSRTWPEENLPSPEHECQLSPPCGHHLLHRHQQHKNEYSCSKVMSSMWGLVFVTARSDGMIKTYHNYGLPVRT